MNQDGPRISASTSCAPTEVTVQRTGGGRDSALPQLSDIVMKAGTFHALPAAIVGGLE